MPLYDNTNFNSPAPVATVSLRNPQTGAILTDVAMLIDSGADISLIPETCINFLNITIDPSQSYELMGFDGNISVSQAVRVDLIFLRKTFKGQFLLTNQNIGILGRDILNNIVLLLNGPQLTWNEEKRS